MHRHIHDFANLLRVGFRQRPAEHGEVLREDINHTAVDRAPAGHNTVAFRAVFLHAEFGAAMGDKHVELFKAVFVQQQLYAFARCQFALGVLRGDTLFTTTQSGLGAAILKLLQNIFHRTAPFAVLCCIAEQRGWLKENSANLQSLNNVKIEYCKIANTQTRCCKSFWQWTAPMCRPTTIP